jgi:hypothetical protein
MPNQALHPTDPEAERNAATNGWSTNDGQLECAEADQALARDSSRALSRELCLERCPPFGAGRPATTRHVRMATIIAGIADFELELIQGRIRYRRRKGPREVLAANLIAHPNRIDLHPWSSHWSAKWRSAARLG